MAQRGSFGAYSDNNYGSYNAGGGAVRDSSNEFTRLSQVIGNNIQKITQNVAQMQRMVHQIGTQQDSPDLRDRLHQVQHYTNQLAKDTTKYLKDLAHLSQPASSSDQKQRKIQKERLMNDFTQALNNFQTAQRNVAEKEKASMARARAHSGVHHDPFADERKSDDQLVDFGNNPPQQTLQMEEDVDLDLLREREQAIFQLEQDITDVNQIFKDLGMLVHEQGEMIDSIEANVENAQVHVQEGTQQLSKASDYQSKARRKKCIIIIIVIVVLAIIGLIIGLTVPRK